MNSYARHPVVAAPSKAHLAYRADIDGLRAIAVFAVIGFHAGPRFVPGGFAGVDIFFVISGYLISGIIFKSLEQGSFNFADFYARRIWRIFPALILVLLSTGIAGWFLLLSDEYKSIGRNIAAGALFLSNFALWHESNYFDTAANSKPLLHLWSLGLEEQFYILWPLLLFLAWKAKSNFFRFVTLLAIVSFILNLTGVSSHAAATFYLPATRFWELLAGGLLAHAELHGETMLGRLSKRPLPDIQSALGLLLVAVAFFYLDEGMPFPGWRALLPVVGTALIIKAGPRAYINRSFLANRFPVFFGLISYPLYLWHWPLLSYAHFVANGDPSPPLTFALVATACVLAWLTYQYVEKPARRQFSKDQRRLVFVLSGLMLLTAIGGVTIWQANGFASRFPQLAAFDTFEVSQLHASWRQDRCFLLPSSPEDNPEAFENNQCLRLSNNARPLILLVGDSHAAALYPGLLSEFGDKANIGQMTSGFCVPMIENVLQINIKDATARCQRMNRYVFAKIRELRPDVLLIAGNYYTYAAVPGWVYPDYLSSLAINIDALAKTGVRHVIVVGQAPTWTAPLPKIAERLILNTSKLPEHLETGLDHVASATDEKLKLLPWNGNVTYVSLIDRLCNGQGCLTRTGDNLPNDLIEIDTGHFSENGSRYVIRNIIGPLIAETLK